MRTALVFLLSAVTAVVLGTIGAYAPYGATDSAPAPVTLTSADQGAHDTFGGPNGAVKLSDDPAVSAGVCRDYGSHVECAPLLSPSGAPMVGKVEEDGSAGYADGLVFDAEDKNFRG